MTKRPQTAGDSIESRCTRCRVVTNHIIVAMVADRVVRVECNTCGGVHNYHPPATAKPPRERAAPSSGRRPRVDRAAAEREAWLAAGGADEPGQAAEYRMDRPYQVTERVRHPLFGLGVVTSVAVGKMEVLFENGRKLLRCGR